MRNTHIVALIALIAAVPAATAGSLLSPGNKPCFIAGNDGYVLSGTKVGPQSTAISATHIVRIDNAAARPSLRMQVVDSPAQADFMLVDDGDADRTCASATTIESIRLDPTAARPELTVALSRKPADLQNLRAFGALHRAGCRRAVRGDLEQGQRDRINPQGRQEIADVAPPVLIRPVFKTRP